MSRALDAGRGAGRGGPGAWRAFWDAPLPPAGRGTLGRARRFFLGPQDPVRLAVFARVFALTLLVYVLWWSRHAYEWLGPRGFHASPAATNPLLPPPLPPLPENLVFPFLAVYVLAIVLVIALGPARKAPIWVLLACLTFTTFADPISSFTLNKLYVAGFLLLALAPPPVAASEEGAARVQCAWPVRVLQLTVILQFFTAGTCKVLLGDWLQHPDAFWTQVQGLYRTDAAAWLLRTLPTGAWTGGMVFALGFELLAPLLFGVRRLRPLAYLWGGIFLIGIALTMHLLVFFSLQLASLWIVFVQPHNLRRALRALVLPSPSGGRRGRLPSGGALDDTG